MNLNYVDYTVVLYYGIHAWSSHSNIMDFTCIIIKLCIYFVLSPPPPPPPSLPLPQPSIPYPSPKKTSLAHPLSPASLPSSATSNPPPLPIKKRMTFKRASVRLLLTVSNKLLTYLSYVVSIVPLPPSPSPFFKQESADGGSEQLSSSPAQSSPIYQGASHPVPRPRTNTNVNTTNDAPPPALPPKPSTPTIPPKPSGEKPGKPLLSNRPWPPPKTR